MSEDVNKYQVSNIFTMGGIFDDSLSEYELEELRSYVGDLTEQEGC